MNAIRRNTLRYFNLVILPLFLSVEDISQNEILLKHESPFSGFQAE